MASRKPHPPVEDESDKHLRDQLQRMLASTTFQQVDRLKRFLTFIVGEAIAGRRNELKEYVIGVQVFGKEDSFDPRTDPIVRVQARRLRAKLVHYYREEGRADEWIVELPKGGYAPTFKRREAPVLVRRSIAAALASRNTIVVSPFADHSAARDLDYFCKGLREEIVHHLARFPNLRILASNAADSSGALVINGSVRQSGELLRVTAQLVDSTIGCYVWSESVDVPIGDGIRGQEQVAQRIVDKLEAEIGDRAQSAGARRPTENLAAHNLYLQGRYHLNQRTEEGLRKAVDFFEKALVEDSQYALAHSGLADSYSLLGHYGVSGPRRCGRRPPRAPRRR